MNQHSWLFSPEEIRIQHIEGKTLAARHGENGAWAINIVGKRILELLEQPQSIFSICAKLSAEFDISQDACEKAVSTYLQNLIDNNYVEAIDDNDADASMRRRYLDLLKRSLVNLLYPEHELRLSYLLKGDYPDDPALRGRVLRDIRINQAKEYAKLIHDKHYGYPTIYAHTLVGLRRLNNLEYCARRIFADKIPGDFFEAGVCQGGAMIFLRALQVAFNEKKRLTWGADSFRGLPAPEATQDTGLDFTESRFPWLAISEDTVRQHFQNYELLSEQVKFVPGWFEDSLPGLQTGSISLLRLDADLYKSTHEVLHNLYDRVSPGGYIVVDDYGSFAPCRQAVDEFRRERNIVDQLRWIDWTGVFWRKSI
ncbi:PqqD family peptide modification chaperone [Undibacterium sp. Ji67W]|uniref:PqqD family peptide modification chaperone n=1 Tax=Undibacterium sp. Ji67W TaxID=3413042 RepID=UPI003BF41879